MKDVFEGSKLTLKAWISRGKGERKKAKFEFEQAGGEKTVEGAELELGGKGGGKKEVSTTIELPLCKDDEENYTLSYKVTCGGDEYPGKEYRVWPRFREGQARQSRRRQPLCRRALSFLTESQGRSQDQPGRRVSGLHAGDCGVRHPRDLSVGGAELDQGQGEGPRGRSHQAALQGHVPVARCGRARRQAPEAIRQPRPQGRHPPGTLARGQRRCDHGERVHPRSRGGIFPSTSTRAARRTGATASR